MQDMYLKLRTAILLYMIVSQETPASGKPALFTVNAETSSPTQK